MRVNICVLVFVASASCAREGAWSPDAGEGAESPPGSRRSRSPAADVFHGGGPEASGVIDAGGEAGPEAGPEPGREAGREAGPEAGPEVPACPAACYAGCNVGCSPQGTCLSCATCACDATTGQCRC